MILIHAHSEWKLFAKTPLNLCRRLRNMYVTVSTVLTLKHVMKLTFDVASGFG